MLVRMRIGHKLTLALAALLLTTVAVAAVGITSLGDVNRRAQALYNDNVRTTEATSALWSGLYEAEETAFRMLILPDGDQRSELEEELEEEAAPAIEQGLVELLTGLPNNRSVQDTLRRMVAQASRTVLPLSAAMLDLDHFKHVNDAHGHSRGDEVLAAVATTLRSSLRESDFVGRYGGEEFLILLPDTGKQQARTVAEKVRAAVEAIVLSNLELRVTASLGVATLPDDCGDADSLVRAADRALYAAKGRGRNRVELFESRRGRAPDPEPAPTRP
jgi:diguanylate cyclase (GGDEF)-like protein